jgi:hypothetical protein
MVPYPLDTLGTDFNWLEEEVIGIFLVECKVV